MPAFAPQRAPSSDDNRNARVFPPALARDAARPSSNTFRLRLEDEVPETHLLRLIEKRIRFDFVRRQLKDSYSDTGRPSIDPELLLRILLIGYLYGITSERKLVEELRTWQI